MSDSILVQSNGNCSTCNSLPNPDTVVKCWVCKRLFHAHCEHAESVYVLASKTMVKTFNAASTIDNFNFSCDNCKTRLEILVATMPASGNPPSTRVEASENVMAEQDDKIRDLTNKVVSIESKLDMITALLSSTESSLETITTKRTDRNTDTSVKSTPTSAAAISNIPNVWNNTAGVAKLKDESTLVIKNNTGGIDERIENGIEKIVVDNNIKFDRSFKNKDGDMVFVCDDSTSCNLLKNAIASTNNELELVTKTDKATSITIVGLRQEYDKNELLQMLVFQNGLIKGFVESNKINIDDHIEITAIRPLKNNDQVFQAFARVTDTLRGGFERIGNKVNIGTKSCQIYDQYFVKRCYNCQLFGHYANSCPTPDQHWCGKCSENHNTRDCTSNDLKCINCKRENIGNIEHETNDIKCPCVRKQQDQMKSQQTNRLNSKLLNVIPTS